MDPRLYRAAESGNWQVIIEFADFNSQQTSTGNTVLHVLAQSCDSSDGAKQILANTPKLALKTNAYLETPLHMAARNGHSDVVRALIDCSKGNKQARLEHMLGARNKDGNTALHEAVRNNCYEAAKVLVEAEPYFQYPENLAGESPLYLAVGKAYHEIVALILSTCMSPSYIGPGKKTALHVAAARNIPDCMNMILEKLPNLVKEVDEFGWTALHYAAKFNHKEVLKLLLTIDKSLAYLTARSDESKTALHVAVTHGHLDVIKEILLQCPDCWDMTTDNFQNILHLAAKSEHKEVLEFILEKRWASELSIQKDIFGETPLCHDIAINELEEFNHMNVLNTAGSTPAEKMAQDKVTEKEMKTYMVVAALIVTVTFAAGFTVPGGYDAGKGNEGMAVLSKKISFNVFVFSDSIALLVSVTSVFLQFMANGKISLLPKSYPLRKAEYMIAYQIAFAMMFMVIAFIAGLYSVLPNGFIKTYLIVYGFITCFPMYLYALLLAVMLTRQVSTTYNRFTLLLNSINKAKERIMGRRVRVSRLLSGPESESYHPLPQHPL